ncbi:hypothetical protein SAMN05216327_11859 [Dyadobacter sp. SG02]|uniref:hypothetical protein n=1 Tax=Dyadobacter sp. SG02 TaxID=1855291 RepID=UPI0008BD59DE|nr:hypothetical protein [Dyadobacter sp. SG02]SEJ74829.1 hypothetical protein SAMN05216327_11859 [Dyadobacter sp. SG02]
MGTNSVLKILRESNDRLFDLIKERVRSKVGDEYKSYFGDVHVTRQDLENIFGPQEIKFFENKLNGSINLLSGFGIFVEVEKTFDNENNFQSFKIDRKTGWATSYVADEQLASLKWLLSSFCADVEIFLLMEDDQETYKEKQFGREEITDQLKFSLNKYIGLLKTFNIDVDSPL